MVGVVTEILLAAELNNNTRMTLSRHSVMLWPFAIQLTGYLHHVLHTPSLSAPRSNDSSS